jgi:mRNA interferase MazF
MTTGTIVLIPFPFAEPTHIKVRPAVVVSTTKDKYRDLILCAVSSVVPVQIGSFEIALQPDKVNNLRVPSVIKTDRIVTLRKEDVIAVLGTIADSEINHFKQLFKQLID